MPSPLLNDPAYCRLRAAELRRLAALVEDGDLRRRLAAMGDEYDRMAARAAVRVAVGIVPPAEAAAERPPRYPKK